VLCVGIYTQFPHKIKRLTPHLPMFINLGEKYLSTLEKKIEKVCIFGVSADFFQRA
jgi:hypothetical protein